MIKKYSLGENAEISEILQTKGKMLLKNISLNTIQFPKQSVKILLFRMDNMTASRQAEKGGGGGEEKKVERRGRGKRREGMQEEGRMEEVKIKSRRRRRK